MVVLVLAFLTQPPALVIVVVFALDWLAWILRKEPVHLGLLGWSSGALYQLIRPRLGAIIAMAPLALIMIAMMLTNLGYFSTGTGFHPRWREAIAYVAKHGQATDLVGRSRQWLDQVTDLQVYFEQRIVQPSHTVHVYRYTPRRPPLSR